jgi:hypothetical protein
LYIGDGRVIGAYGYGTPDDPDNYMKGGNVRETSVEYQRLGGGPFRYITCTKLKYDRPSESKTSSGLEMFDVKQTVTLSQTINIRDAPSTKTGKVVSEYPAGSKVSIDGVILNDGYTWGHYIGGSSGKDRYIALGSTEYLKS